MAPAPRTAIRLIMRRSVAPAVRAAGRRTIAGSTRATRLCGPASDEPAAGNGTRGRLLRGRARLEQSLREVILLGPPPLLAAPLAIALDLALEHGERLLEREPCAFARDVRMQLGTPRQIDGDRAARGRPALRARLVAELHARRGGRHMQPPERRRDLSVYQSSQRPIFAEAFDDDTHSV